MNLVLYNLAKGLLIIGGPVTIVLTSLVGLDDKTAKAVVEVLGALLSVAGFVWLGVDGTPAAITKTASGVPGVQVHVDTSSASPAPESVQELAHDDKVTDVFPMRGGPRTS